MRVINLLLTLQCEITADEEGAVRMLLLAGESACIGGTDTDVEVKNDEGVTTG